MRELSPSLQLHPATQADIAVALAWTPEAVALRRWAGPAARWPTSPTMLREDIDNADASSFALDAPEGGLAAFGQVRFRDQRYGHLARIIVSPVQRGRGLGRNLCHQLMQAALRLHPIEAFSLYVFPENSPAIALYESLGFVLTGAKHDKSECLLMQAPLTALLPGSNIS